MHVFRSREQQSYHRHLDQGLTRLHFPLVVLAHSPIAGNPCNRSLHDPPLLLQASRAGACCLSHHFQLPTAGLLAPDRQRFTTVRGVGPDDMQDHLSINFWRGRAACS